jgi:1,2-phenylacetyl-CoA epoxidase PaaB subunit
MGGHAEDPYPAGGVLDREEVACSTVKNTYSRRNKTVSMWNRSQATMP